MKDFPYGPVTEPPQGFVPPEMWPEFVPVAMPRGICAREEVGIQPRGIRWSLWPITFEEYVGDEEPDLQASRTGALARSRFVMWRPVRRTGTAKGWTALSRRPWRIDGCVELIPGEDYRKGWYKQARRDLRLWQEKFEGTQYRIEPISIDEYRVAFKKSTVAKRIGLDPLTIVERKWANAVGRAHMQLVGIRNCATGQLVAGMAMRYSPTVNSATYESPFMLPEAKHVFAMTALIDHWFKLEAARGTRYLIFNSFWQPGEPKNWKPFSLFKSHFGPQYVAYPPTLWRFVAGKFF